MYNDKMSNIVVEDHNFDLDEILKILKNNALSIESEEKNDIYEGDKLYPEVEINNYDFDKIPTSKKIDLLLPNDIIFGKYKVLKRISEGGMDSCIYSAINTSLDTNLSTYSQMQKVVIKVVQKNFVKF